MSSPKAIAATLNPISSDAISAQRLAAYGLRLNTPADLKLLASAVDSSLAASRTYSCTPAAITGGVQTAPAMPGGPGTCSFGTAPYPGFPMGLTVAQALRPLPEYTMVVNHWDPIGDSWYDSLQAKAARRLSYGLDFQVSYTWSKSLTTGAEDDNNYFNVAGSGGGGFGPQINDVYRRRLHGSQN